MTGLQLIALALALVLGRVLAAAYVASLAGTPEAAGAALRIWVALTSLGAGALAAVAAGGGLASAGAVVALVLISVILSSLARRLGSRHGEAVALSLAPAV